MGYVLLWIENLAVSLLFVATLVACLAQLRPAGLWRWFARGIALLLVCAGAFVVVAVLAGVKAPAAAMAALVWTGIGVIACALLTGLAVLKRPWLGAAAVLMALVPLAFDTVSALLAAVLHFKKVTSGVLFPAFALLAIAYACGAVVVLVQGLRRQAEANQVRAATWPRGRLAIALLVAVALHLMTFWNLDLAARQQLAALRIEAGALALSVAPPRVPDYDNAMAVYQQAFQALGRNEAAPGAWAWEKPWQEAWDGPWKNWLDGEKLELDLREPELRRFLKRQSATLTLLRQAAAKPGCNFDRDYGRPTIDMLLPELSPIRAGARLLALDAICRANDKDCRGAIDNVNAIFRSAAHISTDPLLVSQLVAMIVDGVAVDTLRHVLALGPVPPDDLAALRLPDGLSYRPQFCRAMRMEEAFRLATFDQVGQGRLDLRTLVALSGGSPRSAAPSIPGIFAPVYRVFLLGDDIAAQARFPARLDRLAGLPYDQAKKIEGAITGEMQAHPGGLLTVLLMPALSRIVEKVAHAEARQNAARLGLALYTFRARNGKLPDKLDELVPDFIAAVPVDPFDSQPMRMKHTGQGAIVYSIGPDATDNSGAQWNDEKKTGDITFAIP